MFKVYFNSDNVGVEIDDIDESDIIFEKDLSDGEYKFMSKDECMDEMLKWVNIENERLDGGCIDFVGVVEENINEIEIKEFFMIEDGVKDIKWYCGGVENVMEIGFVVSN